MPPPKLQTPLAAAVFATVTGLLVLVALKAPPRPAPVPEFGAEPGPPPVVVARRG